MEFDPADPRNALYARPRHLTVFISSKMAGDPLAAERRTAIKATENFRLTEPWAWERDAVAGSYYSEEECIRQAGTSDGIILILGEDLTRVTKAEYAAAHKAGAHIVILQKRGVDRELELERFISAVRSDAITKEFTTLKELRNEIDEALWTWTVRAGRTMLLKARKSRHRAGERILLEQAELVDDSGVARPLGVVIEEAEEEVAKGKTSEALDQLYEIASTAVEEDHFSLARILVSELERVIPEASIDERMRGWILNLKGRNSVDHQLAAKYFEQMRQIGIAINDKNLEATAHQNLGVLASIEEHHETARDHFKISFDLKLQIEDGYGAAQLMLNMVNLVIERGAIDAAENLLDVTAESLDGASGLADLRSSLFGLRGLVEAKRGELKSAKAEFKKSLDQARKAQSAAREAVAMQNLGANASERGKQREAIRWYCKALDRARILGDRRRELVLLRAVANTHARIDEWESASEHFAAAADIADLLEDGMAQSEAWANVAACWIKLDKPDVALKLITEALGDPHANPKPDWRATQLMNLGEVLDRLSEPQEAIRRFEEAANLSPRAEQKDQALQRAAEIALVHPGLTNLAPALMERALELQKEAGTNADWAWRAATIGALFSDTPEAKSAITFFTKALRVFARNGDHRRAFYTRNDRAIAKTQIGDLAGAARDLRSGQKIAISLEDRRLQFQAQINLGEVERQRGHYETASCELEAALGLALKARDITNEGSVHALLGLLYASEGRFQESDSAYKKALSIGREHRNSGIERSALGGLAGNAYRLGQFSIAEKRYRQAIRHYGTPSAQLAEDLAGLMMSQAARGKVEEQVLQQLIDVSGEVGWDTHFAEQLGVAVHALLESDGDIEEAVSLQAISLMTAIRAGVSLEPKPFGPGNQAFDQLVRIIMEGVHWILAQPNSEPLLSQLGSEVNKGLDIAEEDEFIDDLISQAVETWEQGQTGSSRLR